MIRKIITINEEKCNGCGLCAAACHEGAIGIVNGKAKLLREDYCDGLGDCLPSCPMGAISFEERTALAYNEAAVKAAREFAKAFKDLPRVPSTPSSGCPGTQTRKLQPAPVPGQSAPSQLQNFPVQLKLAPVSSSIFEHADLLIAADCTAYACGDFHARFIKGRTVLIGCPKLDEGSYTEKLTQILAGNTIRSVTLVRMQVPCCGGLARSLQAALDACGKSIPFNTYIISPEGSIQEIHK